MKTLYDLKQDERAVVSNIKSDRELKERLTSFGVTRGSEIVMKHCNAKRKNIEIDIDGVFVALREKEAKAIEVEVV